jgi:fatty-acyl-CoA synthase
MNHMPVTFATPTPTGSGQPMRLGDFATMLDALDYAAHGRTGLNFYSVKGEVVAALTYAQLQRDALDLAGRLLGAGLRPGERVALVAETSPDFVTAFFACQYAGLIPAPTPLPTAFGGRAGYLERTSRFVLQMRAACLLAPANLVEWLAPLIAPTGLRLCCTVASLSAMARKPLPDIDSNATAYLQFSSGSTRFPLGVMVDHQAAMANVCALLRHGLKMRPGDRTISWLPLYHDMGLLGFLICPMAGQLTIDLIATQDFARRPMLWLSLISEQRCTIAYSPSFGFDLCVRRAKQAQGLALDLSCWRVAGIGGDMIRPAVLNLFTEIYAAKGFDPKAFLPSYGMAEATLAISIAPLGRGLQTDTLDLDRLEQDNIAVSPCGESGRARTLVVCGVPLPEHEVEIRGETGIALGERQVGRLYARGPSLMRGYDGEPAQTDAVLSADGWLDTGDLGYWLDGALVITGRAKDLIIINGRNVWPQDLEWTVEHTVPGIRTGDVAAFSVEEDGQEVLIVAAEARGGIAGAVAQTLAAAIGDSVRAQHGLDGKIILVPANALPYTSSGKLSRSTARRRYLAGTLSAAVQQA